MSVRFSLRKKMFRMMLLVAVIMFLLAVMGILTVLFQSGQSLYNEKITNLKTSASLMEQQLKAMEEISFQIFRNDNLQRILSQIEDQSISDRYQLTKLKAQIVMSTMSYLTQMNSIIGFNIYDSGGGLLATYQIENSALLLADDQAAQYHFPQDGTPAWSVHAPYLVLCRNFRKIENLALDAIGKMCLYIDVSVFQSELQFQALDKSLYVLDAENNSINQNLPEWLSTLDYSDSSRSTYYVHQNQYYLIFHHHSKTTGMTYIDVMNITSLVKQVFLLLIIPCSILLVIVLVIIGISVRWSSRILSPLYALIDDISTVKHWDPARFAQEHRGFREGDDLSLLNAHILRMLRRIDALNKRDYQNQRALDISQYQALQAQIKPHFLYNTLDTMNWIAKENKQVQLVDMLEALADYLRYITNYQETMIPIEKELDAIKKYISIEKFRFEDMLQVEYEIDSDICVEIIPKMTIQPLLENSIKHRQMKVIQPCRIRIVIRRDNDSVLISVEDNGPGFNPAALGALDSADGGKPQGIGLHNIYRRLVLAFGESAALQIESPIADKYGTRIFFHVPIRLDKEQVL